jgi:outer membrane autotransporter protein
LVTGAIRRLDQTDLALNGALSLSFGALTADTTLDSRWMRSQEISSNTVFVGLAAATSSGPFQTSLGLRAGYTGFNHERHVNNNLVFGGIETAQADQNSYWLNLSGDVGYRILVSDAATLTPFARIDHLTAEHDGYTETGIASAATVAEQQSNLTRAEVGLRAAYQLQLPNSGDSSNGGGSLHGSVGLFGNREGGDEAVSLSLLGQSADIALARINDDSGIRISLGYDTALSGQTSFSAGTTYTATESGDTDITANLALRMRF